MAGLEAAQEGSYEISLQHFLAAQEAFPHPATLYNIARTYTDLDDLDNALTYYRLFRDSSPDKAADVDPIVAVLEAKIQARNSPTIQPAANPGVVGTSVAGPTIEEIARLQAIAAELEALSAIIAERTVEPVVVDAGTEGTESGEGTEGTEGSEGTEGTEGTADNLDIPELPGGFISEAYNRVVVTASRYGQEPIDSPSTITVLTNEDIRLSGVTNIPDLLRRVVGAEVMSQAAGHSDVSIRGFNRELANKVLILIDGRSTYLDFIGSTIWASLPISLEEVERIEVIRGPGSAVYGANAVTGVINIITRTPGEGSNIVKVSTGQPGLIQGTAIVTGRKDKTSYRFSAGVDRQGRWSKDYDADAFESRDAFGTDDDLGLEAFRANGRLDVSFDNGFASVSGGWSNAFGEFYNIGVLGDYGIDVQHFYGRGDVAYGPVHLRAFWNSIDGAVGPWTEAKDAAQSVNSGLDSDTIDLELESSGELQTGPIMHRVNGGIGFRYKSIANFAFLGQDFDEEGIFIVENHANAFLNEEATINKVKLVVSLRADKDPKLPLSQTLSPRGSAILRVREDTSVRVTGGTAFRAPNMVERYMNFDLPTGRDGAFIRDFGDETLSPERIVTAELGLHDESSLFHTADVTLYVNQLTDVMGLTPVEPSLTPYDPAGGYFAGTSGWTNLPEVFTGYGAEADLKLFPVDGVDVYLNSNLQQVRESSRDANGDVVHTNKGSGTSLVRSNLGFAYRTPYRFDLSSSLGFASGQTWTLREFDDAGQIVGNQYGVPPRALVSARAAYRPMNDENLEFAATLWNATALSESGRFREHPSGQLVGSRLFGSVSYKF